MSSNNSTICYIHVQWDVIPVKHLSLVKLSVHWTNSQSTSVNLNTHADSCQQKI